jgi:uncharacterized protein
MHQLATRGTEALDLVVSRFVIFGPEVKDEGDTRQIVYSTASGEWLLLDRRTAASLQRREIQALPQYILQRLRSYGFIVPASEDEIAEVLQSNEYATENSDYYVLTLMPSSYCQMGCTYCGQSHGTAHMRQDVQDATVEFVRKQFRARSYRTMDVTWFGGEPLTGIAGIRALTPRLMQIAKDGTASYNSSVITNGLLLSEGMLNELY